MRAESLQSGLSSSRLVFFFLFLFLFWFYFLLLLLWLLGSFNQSHHLSSWLFSLCEREKSLTFSSCQSGPYKCNGVPIRRINQAYVIGTSTVVDVSGVNVPAHIDDKYFSRVSQPKEGEEGFFSNQEKINPEWLSKRQADQEALDTQVLKAVDKTPLLAQYLGAKFTLSKGQAPHNLKF